MRGYLVRHREEELRKQGLPLSARSGRGDGRSSVGGGMAVAAAIRRQSRKIAIQAFQEMDEEEEGDDGEEGRWGGERAAQSQSRSQSLALSVSAAPAAQASGAERTKSRRRGDINDADIGSQRRGFHSADLPCDFAVTSDGS